MRTEFLYTETSLYVDDLEVAEKFYIEIIGLKLSHRVKDQYTLFQNNDRTLILHQTQDTSIEREGSTFGLYEQGQVTLGITPSDFSLWQNHLHNNEVYIDEEITWPNGAQSIYTRDPAGNRIKLKTLIHGFQDKSKEEQIQKVSSGGINAKWKIYHAAKLVEQ